MGAHCVGTAPGVSLQKNRVARNDCSDDVPVNAGNRVYELPVGNILPAVDR
jgi:hypothetical protein